MYAGLIYATDGIAKWKARLQINFDDQRTTTKLREKSK